MRQFHFDFYCFFQFFGLDFFLNGFPNPFIVRSLNCTSGLVLLFFFCSVNFGRSIYSSYRVETGIIRKLVHRRIWNLKDFFDFRFVTGRYRGLIFWDFYWFFRFFGSDFLLDGFRNPFIVRSRPSFFLFKPIFPFSLKVLIHMQHFNFYFLSDFWKWLSQVFCSVFENSLTCTSGLVLLCFFYNSKNLNCIGVLSFF